MNLVKHPRIPTLNKALRLFCNCLALIFGVFCLATTTVARTDDSPLVTPGANAGVDRTVSVGERVILDARYSTHVDGMPIRFHWWIQRAPEDSAAALRNADALRAEFEVDVQGIYVVELEVTDANGATATDQLIVSTRNSRPVALAGPDQLAEVGQTVLLDGDMSGDPDGDVIAYHWKLLSAPLGSAASLTGDGTATPAIFIDTAGDYELGLSVSDHKVMGKMDRLRISTINGRPFADTGLSKTSAIKGERITLDGSESLDPEGQPLAFAWSLLHAPAGSSARLVAGDTMSPSLVPDVLGPYLVQLVVDDGIERSEPVTMVIESREKPAHTPMTGDDIRALYPELGDSDLDLDGVADIDDNCVSHANADQRDTDLDGIGNRCDPDLNNDGIVNFADLNLFKAVFFTNDEDGDFDGNGFINFLDLSIMKDFFFLPPGPPGILTWINGAGGAWNVAANWSPNSLPGIGVTAIIDMEPDVVVSITGGVTAVAGNLMLNDGLSLAGGTLRSANVMSIDSGGTVSAFASSTLDGVTLNVPMSIADSRFITVVNGLTAHSQIDIVAPSSPTGLLFSGGVQTLGGTGSVVFDAAGNSNSNEPQIRPTNGGTLTIGPDLTIRGGGGRIGDPALSTTVLGTVLAEAGIEIGITGLNWSATGSLQAVSGSRIGLLGTMNNANAAVTLDVADGSAWLHSGSSLVDVTINGTPGSVITVPPSVATINGVTLNTDLLILNSSFVTVINGLTLNGTATIRAPSSPTGLLFDGGMQTLGGTGTVVFDAAGNSNANEPQIRPYNGGALTIGAGMTIHGGNGRIGDAGLPTTILGVVSADAANEIEIIGSNWSSTGTLQALNGARISMLGTMNNSSAAVVLDVAGGGAVLEGGPSLIDVVFNGTAGSVITVPAADATLNGVTLNTDLLIQNSGIATVLNGLTLNGTATILAPNSPTGLQFSSGNQTLGGSGTVVFDAATNSVATEPRVVPVNGGALTIGPNILIRGGNGSVGTTGLATIIQGTVAADVSDKRIELNGTNWSATGTLRATNGGILQFRGAMDNAGASVVLDGVGGSPVFTASVTIANAIFNGMPGSVITVSSTDATFNGVTLNADVLLQNGGIVTVLNGLTLNGTASIASTSSPTGFQFSAGNQTLGGTATIFFDAAANSVFTEPRVIPINGCALTIGPNVLIHGGNGSVGASGLVTNIQGTVDADVSAKKIGINGASWTATGTLRASNGGTLEFLGSMDNAGGSVSIEGVTGSPVFGGSASIANAVFNGTPGTVAMLVGTTTLDDVTFNTDLQFTNGSVATVLNGLTLNGTATITAPSSPTGFSFSSGTQTFDGNGTVVFDRQGNGSITELFVRPASGATLILAPTLTVQGDFGTVGLNGLDVVINGTVLADGAGTNIQIDGSSVTVNGLVRASNGASLGIDNLATTSGTLSAFSGGTLTVNSGGLTLASGGFVEIGIDGTAAADFGVVSVNGTADLVNGGLDIVTGGGYSATMGDMFDVLLYNLLQTQFGTVSGADLGGGLFYVPAYQASKMTLVVS